jgi:hypothetical protein
MLSEMVDEARCVKRKTRQKKGSVLLEIRVEYIGCEKEGGDLRGIH